MRAPPLSARRPEIRSCLQRHLPAQRSPSLLAIHLGRIRDLSPAQGGRLLTALSALPSQIESILAREAEIAAISDRLLDCAHGYFAGRAAGYPVAMEGALKLKEASYVHAEAYPASELKHGPLALISPQTPTIIVMPHDDLPAKNVSTVEEIRARRGPVLAIIHSGEPTVPFDDALTMPVSEPELTRSC